MSTGKMKHVKSSLDRIGFRFPRQDSFRGRINDVDDYNGEIFLEASLQFLYSLLAERTALQINDNDVPMPHRYQVSGNASQESGTASEINLEMENFFPNIPPNVFRNLKSCTDSYASTPVRLFSSPNYGEYDISNDIKKSNTPVEKLTPHTTKDLQNSSIRESISYANIVRNAVSGLTTNYGRKRTGKTKDQSISANSLQGSSGPPGNVGNSFEGRRNRSSPGSSFRQSNFSVVGDHESKTESDVSSEPTCLEIPNVIPLQVELANVEMKMPMTLRVKVSDTVLKIFNRKISKRSGTVPSSLPAASKDRKESKTRAKRKQRLVSTIFNLLRGGSKGTCCTSSICVDLLEKDQIKYSPSDSNVTSNSIGRRSEDYVRNDEKNTRRNKLINTLRSVSKETRTSINNGDESSRRNTIGKFSLMHADSITPIKVNRSLKPPQRTNTRNIKVRATAVSSANCKCHLVSRKPTEPTRPEFLCDKPADEIPKGVRNYSNEIIIPLRCSQDLPWLDDRIENVGAEKISQNDVDTLHGRAAEIRRIQTRRHPASELRTEIPVEIKIRKAPLHLRKTDQASSANFWEQRDFEIKTRSHRVTTTDGFQGEKFSQLLDETLPEGINYFPLHSNDFNKSEGLCRMQDRNLTDLNSMREKSALQVLFRQIATDASIISESIELKSFDNNDKAVPQTAPKRQLSKISVCSYSSESLSGSDQESSDFRTKSTSLPRDEETEIIIEEENDGSALSENSSSSALAARRESERSIFCSHPVLRNQVHNLEL